MGSIGHRYGEAYYDSDESVTRLDRSVHASVAAPDDLDEAPVGECSGLESGRLPARVASNTTEGSSARVPRQSRRKSIVANLQLRARQSRHAAMAYNSRRRLAGFGVRLGEITKHDHRSL